MLKGEKVTLRPMERDDLKRIHEMRQDVELMILAFGDWQPRPLARLEKDFDKNLERDEGTWFVIEADGKIIGDSGLHGLDRRHGTAELGIGIYDREYLGKGYGRDYDQASADIMNSAIIPAFKRGDFSGGIRAGVDALAKMASTGPGFPTGRHAGRCPGRSSGRVWGPLRSCHPLNERG